MSKDGGPTNGLPAKGDATRGPAKVPGREALRAPLPKRFYKLADVAASAGGFGIMLDGCPIKTPGKKLFVVPARQLAEAIAAEWRAQADVIDPATMPLTRICNSAIDAVRDAFDEVAADIAAFAASDLICYRAEGPRELIERQAAAWNPIVEWAQETLKVRLAVTTGVMPVEQPNQVTQSVARHLHDHDAFGLAAVHVLTTLSGSALLALTHAAGQLPVQAAWAAAHVDESWQIEQWGEDAEASTRRAHRLSEFEAASRLLSLL